MPAWREKSTCAFAAASSFCFPDFAYERIDDCAKMRLLPSLLTTLGEVEEEHDEDEDEEEEER